MCWWSVAVRPGTAAAVAAARLGADVVLLERYNHLGGLSTGGLVIWIDRMTDWAGKLVIRGFAEELLARLTRGKQAGPAAADWGSNDPDKVAYWALRTAAYHGTVTYSPTIDPEWLKAESLGWFSMPGSIRFSMPGALGRWSRADA